MSNPNGVDLSPRQEAEINGLIAQLDTLKQQRLARIAAPCRVRDAAPRLLSMLERVEQDCNVDAGNDVFAMLPMADLQDLRELLREVRS